MQKRFSTKYGTDNNLIVLEKFFLNTQVLYYIWVIWKNNLLNLCQIYAYVETLFFKKKNSHQYACS